MERCDIAAGMTLEHFNLTEYPGARDPEGKSVNHAIWLLRELKAERTSENKAHRWLGWAQCILVFHGLGTLEDMKQINKAASDVEKSGDPTPATDQEGAA